MKPGTMDEPGIARFYTPDPRYKDMMDRWLAAEMHADWAWAEARANRGGSCAR